MAYNAANTYATIATFTTYVTEGGWLNIADRDGDGVVSAAELATIEDCVESANNMIDAAIDPHMSPDVARASGNDWLRDRCHEITAYRASGAGGRDVPDSVYDLYVDAVADLKRVRSGELIVPRLNYPKTESNESTRAPRAINPGRRHYRRRN